VHEIDSRPQDIDVNAEMDVDHIEHMGVDAAMGDGEDDDLEPTILPPPGGKRDVIVALWPFAFSKEYYKAIVEGVCGGERISHIVVLSTSAHPAYALAAHDLGLTAHVHLDRVSGHSRAHGRQILRNFIHQEFLSAERALHAGGPGAKRIRAEALTFVRVSAPPVQEQTLCFTEVPGIPGTSAWRACIDKFPASDALEKGVLELVKRELETFGLAVRPAQDGGRPALVTERARGDGDVICPVSCLLFSDADGLRECLNAGDNAALLAGPMLRIAGLRCPGGGVGSPGGEVMDVYGIPVGAARLAHDYRVADRHSANARIRVRPSQGPNDGFLELVVRTHNGQGMAAGRDILLDLGAARAWGQEPTAPPTKRIKGALEVLLEKQMARGSAHAAEDEATPTAALVAAQTAGAAPGAPEGTSADAPVILAAEGPIRTELRGTDVVIFSTTGVVAKLPPKTILAVFDKGTMQDPPPGAEDSVQWVFRKCTTQARQAAWRVGLGSGGRGDRSARGNRAGVGGGSLTSRQVVVMGQGTAGRRVTTLAEFISSSGADSVWNHQRFTAVGVPPPHLTVKTVKAFAPEKELADVFPRLVQHLKADASKLCFLWVVHVKGNKILPYGLALVAKTKITARTDA